MRSLFVPIISTAFSLAGGVAGAAEIPTYELMGFPITPHQMSVVGSANIQEQSPTSTLVLGGMPASPHQVAVLTLRARETLRTADKLTQAGSSDVPPR
jgi:hypothetical protein